MKKSNYSPTEAATIIQRNLRKYLLRKQQRQRLNKLETLPNSETSKYENEVSEREKHAIEVHKVQNVLESIHELQISGNLDPYKYNDLIDLINDTDATVRRSESVTSLETFSSTEAHNSDCEDFVEEARRRHLAKLNLYDVQWWDRLPW